MEPILISSGDGSAQSCTAYGFACWHAATYPVHLRRGSHIESDAYSSVLLKYGPDWTTPGLAELCNIASQLDLIGELLEKWDFAVDVSNIHDCASSDDKAALDVSAATGQLLDVKHLQVCMFCDSDEMVEAALTGDTEEHAEWLHLVPLMQYIRLKRMNIQKMYNIDLVLTRPNRGRRSNIIRISDNYARLIRRITEENIREQRKHGSRFMGSVTGTDKAGFPIWANVFPETDMHKTIRECSRLIANMVKSGRNCLR